MQYNKPNPEVTPKEKAILKAEGFRTVNAFKKALIQDLKDTYDAWLEYVNHYSKTNMDEAEHCLTRCKEYAERLSKVRWELNDFASLRRHAVRWGYGTLMEFLEVK